MSEDFTLKDDSGEVITTCDRDLASRWLKHECPDGDYSIEGPDIDLKYFRIDGIIYPAGGTIDGGTMPIRTREQCIAFFTRGEGKPDRN